MTHIFNIQSKSTDCRMNGRCNIVKCLYVYWYFYASGEIMSFIESSFLWSGTIILLVNYVQYLIISSWLCIWWCQPMWPNSNVGACIMIVTWHCQKLLSQWQGSCHLKAALPLAKWLVTVPFAEVLQTPGRLLDQASSMWQPEPGQIKYGFLVGLPSDWLDIPWIPYQQVKYNESMPTH